MSSTSWKKENHPRCQLLLRRRRNPGGGGPKRCGKIHVTADGGRIPSGHGRTDSYRGASSGADAPGRTCQGVICCNYNTTTFGLAHGAGCGGSRSLSLYRQLRAAYGTPPQMTCLSTRQKVSSTSAGMSLTADVPQDSTITPWIFCVNTRKNGKKIITGLSGIADIQPIV